MGSQLVVIPALRAKSNHAGVARAIGADIISGRMPAGSKLPNDAELIALYGVSRPVLRESVKTLVAKGLLTTKARVGTLVRDQGAWNMFDPDVLSWHMEAGIDAKFLRDLADIRFAIEPRTARLAAECRSAADLAEMERALRVMRDSPSDSTGFADGDLLLHVTVANASGNRFMRSIGAVIDVALRASFRLSAPVEEGERATVIEAHEAIVDAIERRDGLAAAEAMRSVILNGMRRHGAAGWDAAYSGDRE